MLINFGKNSNLIYCNAKSKTIEYATIFAQSKSVNVDNKRLNKAASIIREYIHPDYYLSELIKKGVAYHFGNMPQLIRNLIEELYKNGDLNFVFCTSTLLEGVNMPTQNLFILDHKKSKKSLTTIDFWNLAGRAGRLARELQGNIFCIKHMGDNWDKVTFFENKEIQLTPAIFDKIDHNLKKIEAIIQNKDISGTESEKNILKYIANIICVDTLEAKTGYSSPIIDALIEKNKSKIIEIAKAKSEKYETPYAILSSNESIGLDSQDAAYRRLKYLHAQKRTITFPSQVNYNTCLDTLNTLYDLYKWENNNKYLSKKNSLKYFATLMNKWINDESLNKIISNSIDYYGQNQLLICVSHNQYEKFDRLNKGHINILIGNIIDDIERVLRFQLEKYFNHYYLMVKNLLGEDKAGENWATLLEYGTQNRIIIALQNIGLSRHSANKIYKECRDALIIENGKLKHTNKSGILSKLNANTLEYDEVLKLL